MLVLSRRIRESLMIENNVVISVLGVKGSKLQIGITALKDIHVYREEVYEKINLRNTSFRGEKLVVYMFQFLQD